MLCRLSHKTLAPLRDLLLNLTIILQMKHDHVCTQLFFTLY